MADNKFDLARYYSELSRLFKGGGPTVRQRVANKIAEPGAVGQPIGTARAFLKASSNLYASHLAAFGQYSRLARYSDYSEMESNAILGAALDIYADEICSKGEYGEILRIDSPNSEIKKVLTSLFYDVLNIEFNAQYWVRNLCKYGDQFLLVDHHPDYGVMNLLPMPINEIERQEGYDPDNPLAYRFRWVTQGNRELDSWQVIHFRLLGNDNFLPYGTSVLEPARRIWRQLTLMEDAMMVYRIVRSPERRVFYIDVGNIDPNDVTAYVEKAQTQLKRSQVVDSSTGRVDLRYNPLSTDEDYFIPVRGQEQGSRIETLPGGQFTGDVEDVEYLQAKLFAALKIPKAYLGYEADLEGKASLSQMDVRFARTIQRIQRILISELNKIAVIHLWSYGFRDNDVVNFEISMANPSTISEIQRLELWRTKFEVASAAQEGFFDRDWIYRKIYKLSDEDIEGIQEGKRNDKMFDMEIESIQLPAEEQEVPPETTEPSPGEPGAPEGSGPGQEEQPAQQEEPSQGAGETSGPQEEAEGKDPNKQVAMPNELKGKFKPLKPVDSPGSIKNRVFNTKKNGLDPMDDVRFMKRIASSPFGEAVENDEDIVFKTRVADVKRFAKTLEEIDIFKNHSTKKKPRIL